MASSSLVDYAILCFKTEEFDALLRRFCEEACVAVREPRREYTFRRMHTRDGRKATLALVRTVTQGLVEAQNAATDMIEDLDPRCLVVCGIAGGRPSTDFFLGDVVLATRIHDFSLRANTEGRDELATEGYMIHRRVGVLLAALPAKTAQLGNWSSEEELNCPRPSSEEVDLSKIRGSDDWKERVQRAVRHHKNRNRPLFVDGPVASSDDLVRTEKSMRERLEVDRRILAVEMESAGVAKACERSDGVTPLIVVRAISDIPGLDRHEDYNAYACNVAASFTKALVQLDAVQKIDVNDAERVASSRLTELVAVGASLRDPAPAVIFQRSFKIGEVELKEVAEQSAGSVEFVEDTSDLVRFRNDSMGSPSDKFVQPTLYEMLNFIEENSVTKAGMEQCRNALSLFRMLDESGQRLMAERMFDVLDKPVKSIGDKQLVIQVAEACIQAVSHKSRSPAEAQCEARARICGLSWAYQRMGMLDRAADEADKSQELARFLNSKTNLAFCMKCTGRLARLRAEATENDRSTRNKLFRESITALREAVDEFSHHENFGLDHAEIGDCYSLLGRTYLSRGDIKAAKKNVELASNILTEKSSKDYLDLQILQGEIAVEQGDHVAAHTFFREVLGTQQNGDYQRSEIVARAFVERAKLYIRSGKGEEAAADYARAANIWNQYGEQELSGKAQYEAVAAKHQLPRSIRRILEEESSFAVRAAACRRYFEGGLDSRPRVLSKRSRPDAQVMRTCLRLAREDQALRRRQDEW